MSLASLDNSPWLVRLDAEDRYKYIGMVRAEGAFLEALEALGCPVVRPERTNDRPSRRALAIVPPGVPLPPSDRLCQAVAMWRETVEGAAAAQGKSDTVGVRGATVPVWLGQAGQDVPFTDDRPDYQAVKVTHRLQAAYRGAALSPGEAVSLLQDRLERSRDALLQSERNYQHERASEQRQRIDDLESGIGDLLGFIMRSLAVSVRMHSGMAWRIHVKTADTDAIAASVSTIALVPGTADTLVEEARKRHREDDPSIESILLPGGLEVRIKRI
jgi:hypothetical protein